MGGNWCELLVNQLRISNERFIANEGSTVGISSGDSYSLSFALYITSIQGTNGPVERL